MLKNDFDELEVGDWCFVNGHTYICIRIGEDKFRESCMLPILSNKTGEIFKDEKTGRPYWNWNGSEESPSLTPSILHWGNGRKNPATWHGYLTDGKLVTA